MRHGRHDNDKKKNPRKGGESSKHHQYPTPADFARVNAAALACLDAIVQHFAPGGKVQGREYVTLNPTRVDTTLGSFKINLDTCEWGEFADSTRGGDPIGYVSYVIGAAHQSEGLRALAEFLHIPAVEDESTQAPGPRPGQGGLDAEDSGTGTPAHHADT